MFYQEYREKINVNFNPIVVKDKEDQNKTLSNYLKANQAYYIKNNNQMFYIKGTNGYFELQSKVPVFYNPLNDAALYVKNEDNLVLYEFQNSDVEIYEIPNLLDGKIVSKIQVEFSEKYDKSENKTNHKLSNNAIFINTDMIKGYKQTDSTERNIYSFETIDNVATKIRYLGIIPCNMQENDFIILNYYTTD